jgi:hypothetical protein
MTRFVDVGFKDGHRACYALDTLALALDEAARWARHPSVRYASVRDLACDAFPAVTPSSPAEWRDAIRRAREDVAFLEQRGQAAGLARAKKELADLRAEAGRRGIAVDEPFEKLEHSLAHKKGVRDPGALAAYIGREHGKIP